jgi:hypothetical protein
MRFETKMIGDKPDVIALDGSEVRVLCGLSRGGLAVFSLAPHAVSKAVAHRTIEEIWYLIAGHGRIWRKLGGAEEITEIGPGVSICCRRRHDAALARSRRSLSGRRHLAADGVGGDGDRPCPDYT